MPAAGVEQAPKSGAGIPSLVVSGIAYLGDKDGRIAVVNDLPVMVGNLVDGARVEEILPDRVRFSRDGKKFEVPLQER
jgi:general secretion pathway protein B